MCCRLPNFTSKLEQSRILCAHATPVMESLHEQIVNTQSMIVLTDAEGLILHSIGDDDFLRRAEKVALRPGANWAEERQGTNAIGTASPSAVRPSCMANSTIWPPIAFSPVPACRSWIRMAI